MRRPSSSPVKTEGERSPVGQGPPKSCVDVKSERTHDSQEQHSTVEKSTLLSKSPVAGIIIIFVVVVVIIIKQILAEKLKSRVHCQRFKLTVCSCVSPGGLERVKTELREEVSGHSSVSDVDSDSDSPTEVHFIYHTISCHTL